MVVADLSIFPLDKGTSLSPYVARALNVIKQSGLAYTLGPMGTAIEGEFDAVMEVVGACFTELQTDCDRIIIHLKVDYRKGRTNALKTKPASVLAKLPGE